MVDLRKYIDEVTREFSRYVRSAGDRSLRIGADITENNMELQGVIFKGWDALMSAFIENASDLPFFFWSPMRVREIYADNVSSATKLTKNLILANLEMAKNLMKQAK